MNGLTIRFERAGAGKHVARWKKRMDAASDKGPPRSAATASRRQAYRPSAPAHPLGRAREQPVRPTLLQRARGEAGDVVVEEEDVKDDDGDGAENGAPHERTPEVAVATDQLGGDANARGDLLRRGGEGQRVD